MLWSLNQRIYCCQPSDIPSIVKDDCTLMSIVTSWPWWLTTFYNSISSSNINSEVKLCTMHLHFARIFKMKVHFYECTSTFANLWYRNTQPLYLQWAWVKLCIVHCVWYYVQLQPNSLHTQSLYIHIQGLCIFISEVSKRTNTYVCTYVLSSRNFCKTMVKVVKMNCWAIRLRLEISKYYIVTP